MIIKDVFRAFTRNLVTLTGVAFATIAGVLIVSFLVLDALGFSGGPYIGILIFGVVPTLLVLGLILIPIGKLLQRRRERLARERGVTEAPLVIDFSKPYVRWIVAFVIIMTCVNVALLAGGTYKAVETMDTTEFCGATCHVMHPEFTVYQRSPHSHVACVECHIGAGASWFVKSKISGVKQVFAVAFNSYPRPIATPVHDLRPARETCEKCHWPQRFTGDRLKILTSFTDDEKTEARKTVLLMKVGGWQSGKPIGIHWHIAPDNRVRYLSDAKRLHVAEIQLTDASGAVKRDFKLAPDAAKKTSTAGYEWRVMDCIDCHNRPTHIYGEPAEEVDKALLAGTIDKDLPYIRREAVRIVQGSYASHDAAATEIPAALRDFYAKSYPDVLKTRSAAVKSSGEALAAIWNANVFPEMKITWGTYPSFANHHNDSGCFRCHNDDLVDDKGKKMEQECDGMCHTPLATESKKPEILDLLYPED